MLIFLLLLIVIRTFAGAANSSADRCSMSGNHNTGFHYYCSDRGFDSIPTDFHPRTTEIHLPSNNITEIPSRIFQNYRLLYHLDLSNNKISKIDVDAFHNCSRIQTLLLDHNELTSNEKSVPIGSLAPLVSLRSLYIYRGSMDNLEFITDEICGNLHGLTELEIDIFDKFQFSEHCANLRQLKNLTLVVRHRTQFLNSSLKVLTGLNVEKFRLKGTGKASYYKPIEAEFLRPLQSLKVLQIDGLHNCYISYILRTMLYPLQNRTIDLSFDNFLNTPIQSITTNDLSYIKNMCVRNLVLTKLNIQSIEIWTLMNSTLWHCLEEFDVSGNYLIDVNSYFFGFSLPRIRILNLCCQFLSQGTWDDTNVNRYTNPFESENRVVKQLEVQVNFPDSLRSISFDNNDLQSTGYDFDLILNARNVETFSLRNFHFQNCIGTLKGLQNLRKLQFVGSNCVDINPYFIANLTSVRELTISSLLLGRSSRTMISLLANLTDLTYVDMSKNIINDLHPIFFRSQIHSMRNLSLASNLLKFIPKSVMSLQHLRHLDMRHNLISSLTNDEMEFIDKHSDFTIELLGNDLQCTCDTLTFLSWLQQNSQKVRDFKKLLCVDEEHTKLNVSYFMIGLQKKQLKCISKIALYIAIFGNICLFLCISLILTLVKFQADVHYMCARIRRRFRSKKEKLRCEEKFHAFVSYGNAHYQWALETMKPELEKEGFRVMFPDVHFEPGASFMDNVMDAIDNSRRFVFVISRDFLADEWCKYTMEVSICHALHKQSKNFIIVIICDGIPLHLLPKSLRQIWIRVHYTRWPEEDDIEAVHIFWKKLKEYLRSESQFTEG